MKSVLLGSVFPNLTLETTEGTIKLHEWLGNSWGIIFSHPADYTPVCTTELGKAAQMYPEFSKRNVKLLGLSCDSIESHYGWINDIKAYCNIKENWPYPIISDPKRLIAEKLGMIDSDEKDAAGIPLTCRAVFIIGPDKKLKSSILYPATTGRNFNEILRLIDSLQLTASHKVATPVDWKPGQDCMVIPTVSEEETKVLFPLSHSIVLPSQKDYMRFTPQPH